MNFLCERFVDFAPVAAAGKDFFRYLYLEKLFQKLNSCLVCIVYGFYTCMVT